MYAVNLADLAIFARESPMIHAILFPPGALGEVLKIGKRIDGFICPFVNDDQGLNIAQIFKQRYPRGGVRFYEKSAASWRAIRLTPVIAEVEQQPALGDTRRAAEHDG